MNATEVVLGTKTVSWGEELRVALDDSLMNTAVSVLETTVRNTDFLVKAVEELTSRHSDPSKAKEELLPYMEKVLEAFRKVTGDAKMKSFFAGTAIDAEFTIEENRS